MTGIPAGWRLRIHDVLPSTADAIRALAEAGEPGGLAVLAFRQTAGRGTQGRGWESPPGNLFLSVLLRPDAPAREVPQWGLLAGVALHSALLEHAGPSLALKWPNDLLLDGVKCAGILAEGALAPSGRLDWLSFGFGVNLAYAPPVPGRATAALPPPAWAPEEAAAAILEEIDRWRAVLDGGGFAAIREAWLRAGHAPGAPMTVDSPRGRIAGHFDGLDETGALRLRTAAGLETVMVGQVMA